MSNITASERSSVSNISKQFDLIRMFGLPETMAERYYVRIDKDKENPDAKPTYVLCKRESPISIFDDGSGNHRCVANVKKTYAERLGGFYMKVDGLNPDVARSVVENQLCQSIDTDDVEAFASI